ncbi:MAG: terminase family protein [bacterium]|nr:terminase family protein [bacterium]
MFNPAEALRDNPALFACYLLFIYFRGRNAVRIEREMRSLGHATFHRRNLYPRGHQPGWIAKYGWTGAVGVPPTMVNPTRGRDADDSAPSDFHSWLKRVSPNMTWDWRHQQVIIEQLNKVSAGDCKRLMIFLPPRHGKSELVSVRYTAWRMQKDPWMNVILGSYNHRLADKMSRKIRTVVCDAESIRLGKGRNPTGREGVSDQPQINANKRRSDTDRETEEKDIRVNPRPSAVSSSEYGSPFPFSRPRPKNAVSEWETATGGSFRAVGAGSGVTGFGANLIVIDDPVKNRAQAESETYRNRVWDWYKDDLYTRLEPDGSIVLIQTRWHEDDLAGRLLRDDHDNWTIINLPALSEPDWSGKHPCLPEHEVRTSEEFEQDEKDKQDAQGGNPTGREGVTSAPAEVQQTVEADDQDPHPLHPLHPVKTSRFEWRSSPNIALCPERFPVEALEQQRRQLGTYSFSALYQQRPTPAGGQIFKREWFKNIIDFAPPDLKWKRGYDLAVSTRTDGDYTASFRCAFDKQGNLYISGGFRRRIEFPEQRRYIIDRMLNERDTEHGVELALHGQALIQELRRDPTIRGKSLSGVKVSTDKLTRALTWSPLAEEGKVILVRNQKDEGRTIKDDGKISASTSSFILYPSSFSISDLLDELTAFPNGTHDDQIDAISLAVQMLAKREFKARGYLIT